MQISELARLTGVSMRALRHYEDRGTELEMCPSLHAELDSMAERLSAKQAELRRIEQRLHDLVAVS